MKIIETPVNFSTKYGIVDVEISNVIAFPQYEKGEICLAGFFIEDKITQIMLTDKSKASQFRIATKDFLSTLDTKQLYAFNTQMENGCFRNLLGYSPKLYEIKPFKGRGVNKEYLFGILISKGKINVDFGFEDPLKGQSDLCMDCWRRGQFEDVRKHNLCCLTKEAKILEHKSFLVKAFSPLLNEDGWIKDGAVLPNV